jgi:predicted transcriptional regulator
MSLKKYDKYEFKNENSIRVCFLLEQEGSKDRIELKRDLEITEKEVIDILAELNEHGLLEKDGLRFYKLKHIRNDQAA